MRKLKAGLVLLFSIMMSLCLFACTPAEENPNPDDSSGETGKVLSARFQSDTATITLTDEQAKDEATRNAAIEKSAATLNVQVTIEGESRVQIVKGDELVYNTEGVDWTTVGVYTATATLETMEGYDCGEGVVLSNKVSIRIDHAFGEVVDGTATCQCGATKTVDALEEGQAEVYNIGAFHAGITNNTTNGDLELLAPFGTVAQGSNNTEVLTMTAGTIRKGMTVTLYGTAVNGGEGTGTDFYDYPNLGIALRNFDTSSTIFPITDSAKSYVGGMSVIVRSDGWVLMDGIGDNGNSRYGTRMLAGLVGGNNANFNYTSVPNGNNSSITLPWPDYDCTQRPADTSTWGDWAVYSSGATFSEASYYEQQQISFTYTFRNDNVIEIVYTVYAEDGTAGDVFTCCIKIPEAYANSSFDTIVHGEYTNMTFTSMEIIEQQKLDTVSFKGLGSDAKKNYLAGEVFNLDDLDGNVKVTYANSDVEVDPDSFSLQVYRGEGEATEDSDAWVTLVDNTRLLATDKNFRIMVKSGSMTVYDYMNLGDSDFVTLIEENSVTEVYGVGDSATLGNVGFASDNAAAPKLVISPVGTANAVAGDIGNDTGYIVLRVYGTDLGTATTSGIAEILETNKDYFDVKVTVGGAESTATITGAQETDIVIDVSGVTSPVYAVSVDTDYIPANTGANVTFVFTVSTDIYESARVGMSEAFTTCTTTDALGDSGTFRNGVAYTAKTEAADGITTLTLTVEIPAMEVGGTGYAFINFYTGTNNITRVYYGEPVAAEGSAVVELPSGEKGYFTSSGNNLYLVVVGTSDNILGSRLTTGDILVNINNGAGSVPGYYNVGVTYDIDRFVYADEELTDRLSASITLNGTTDSVNAYDNDFNYVITQAIDLTKFGIKTNNDYYFEYGFSEEDMIPVHVVVADGVATITAATLGTTAVNIVEGGDCFTSRVDGYPVTVDGVDVFYGNLTTTPAEHQWGSDLGGYFVCSECGAITKNNGTQWTISAEQLAGVSETGLTVTMNTSGVTGDWGAAALVSGQHNAIITLPNLDPYNMVTEGMTDEEAAIAATLTETNFFPGATDFYNGGVWNAFVNTDATPSNFTTVVVEPGEEGGISYYLNGVLVVKYSYDRLNNSGVAEKTGTAGDYVELFLSLVERTGLIVANAGITAADAVVYPDALSATQVEALYGNNTVEGYYPTHVHSYETDTTADDYDHCACGQVNPAHGTEGGTAHVADVDDPETEDYREDYLCKVCGEAMPNHEHDYVDEICIYCGEVDPNHAVHTYVNGICACGTACAHQFTDGVCASCGATITTVEVTDAVYENPTAFETWYEVPVSIYYGSVFTVEGTQNGPIESNWLTVLWEIKEGFTGRLDNWGWTFGDGLTDFTYTNTTGTIAVTDASGAEVATGEDVWTYFPGIAAESEYSLTFDWTNRGQLVVTIELTATSGTYAGYTYTNVSLLTVNASYEADTMNLHLTAEQVNSFSVTSYTYYAYPASDAE